MPFANKYEIHEVIEACRYYFETDRKACPHLNIV